MRYSALSILQMLNPNLPNFGGECSDDEISRCIKHGEQSDLVIGIGGVKQSIQLKLLPISLMLV